MDSTININLVPKDEIKVFYGTEAHIDNKASVLFIKSGQKEIDDYVETVSKPDISNYVETEAKPLVTQIINEIAEPTVEEYIEGTVKPDLDDYADSLKPELQAYVTQASNYADNSQASATASAASANAAKTSETNAKASETAAKQSETNAKTSETNAKTSDTNAEIWAEGTDSQVQALGGEKSAKGWAEASTNLDYTNITNCITKIPQDIKLEINNGTLTLKAGSKVYVPNGVGVFNEVIIQSDEVVNTAAVDGKLFAYLNDDKYATSYTITQFSSGTTAPSSGFSIWFDTDAGKIKRYTGATFQDEGSSFPFAAITVSGGKVTSIDQVFNGFGYIGSTVFALPGVEGLIPNYRNVDGSLNNVEWTCNSVIARTISGFGNYDYYLGFNGQGFSLIRDYLYNQDENINLTQSVSWPYTWVGNIRLNSDVITSFNPKTAFLAVDRNDSEWLSGLSSPSDRYIEIDVSGNSLNYTPPEYGYIVAQTPDTGSNGTLEIIQGQMMSRITVGLTVNTTSFIKVTKGKNVSINCDIGIKKCVFIYDNGVK